MEFYRIIMNRCMWLSGEESTTSSSRLTVAAVRITVFSFLLHLPTGVALYSQTCVQIVTGRFSLRGWPGIKRSSFTQQYIIYRKTQHIGIYTHQMVNIHTREDKTLDLLFTNSPSPINRVKGMPPIGKADHDIVYIEYDIKAKRIQQAPRKIFLYKRIWTVSMTI